MTRSAINNVARFMTYLPNSYGLSDLQFWTSPARPSKSLFRRRPQALILAFRRFFSGGSFSPTGAFGRVLEPCGNVRIVDAPFLKLSDEIGTYSGGRE